MKATIKQTGKWLVSCTLLLISLAFNNAQTQGDNYIKHGTTSLAGGYATLYYKVTEHGIRFKLENNTKTTLYCKISNVYGEWSDGKTRTKDVYIKWIPAGQSREEVYWQTDNYSTLNQWEFDGWRVATDIDDL